MCGGKGSEQRVAAVAASAPQIVRAAAMPEGRSDKREIYQLCTELPTLVLAAECLCRDTVLVVVALQRPLRAGM